MTADEVLDALQKHAPAGERELAAYYVTAKALAIQGGAAQGAEQLALDARRVVDEATEEEIETIIGEGQ